MRQFARRTLLLLFGAVIFWYGMEFLHESGHMFAALLTGGKIEHLGFPLLGFSRTEISPNPHPALVAWAGPVFGGVIPLLAYLAFRLARLNSYFLHLFAAFCLLANGAYLGIGSFDRIGDAGDILRRGCPIQWLWMFGVVAGVIGIGLLKALQLPPVRPKTSSAASESDR